MGNPATIEFVRASTEHDREAARCLREEMYAGHYTIDPKTWDEDVRRDDVGYVFVARVRAQPVATVRIMPLQAGHSELAELGLLPASVAADAPTLAEGGRLAARLHQAPGPRYGLLMQVWSSQWMLTHTPVRRWIAWCKSEVLPIWRRVGTDILGGPFDVPGLGDGEFFVIGGPLQSLVDAGVRMGYAEVAESARRAVGGQGVVQIAMPG